MSLASKLAEVMKAVERIPKRGHNTFHNYDYATEADIVGAIRDELADRQVFLIPGITGFQRDPVGEKGSVLTTLSMTFTFFDGESGEQIERPWLGAGTDKEDKGAYKAMTGGEKYFLLKTFLIPTGDDPEQEEGVHPQATMNRREFETRKPPAVARQAPPPVQPPAHPGEVRVTNAKVAKVGTNAKGPWTLYAVKFSDGREGTTFSKSLYEAADEACRDGLLVEAQIDGKNLVGMTPVYRDEMESEMA